jgi:hypothetical protein
VVLIFTANPNSFFVTSFVRQTTEKYKRDKGRYLSIKIFSLNKILEENFKEIDEIACFQPCWEFPQFNIYLSGDSLGYESQILDTIEEVWGVCIREVDSDAAEQGAHHKLLHVEVYK